MNLTDVNDNAPQFRSIQPVNIEENRTPGSPVTFVTATDADQGLNAALSYTIMDGNFNGIYSICSVVSYTYNS